MAQLLFERQVEVIAQLISGTSIRKTEELTGVHRDTIMRLSLRVGAGCALIHDAFFQKLIVLRLELDETWSFVGKKQRKLKPSDPEFFGDQYIFVALDATTRAVVSYWIGKRNSANTMNFIQDLKSRLVNVPMISSDSFQSYEEAVRQSFGEAVHYGQLIKMFKSPGTPSHGEDVPPPHDVAVLRKAAVIGNPDLQRVSTSLVERQNLTIRMNSRRMTRRTSGYSKKLENHLAAIHLHFAYYNFCRIHETIRTAPAHRLGVIERPWPLHQLIYVALNINLMQQAA
ncbi:MAG: IS1 family transposase [Hyphomicrobiaceae bacterium]|nr:IS1 family transposase [Hyphomicrobiaceae bacterium]